MDWKFLIFIVIQIVITLGLFYLIKNYFPAYFSEKGKNVATKEDIEEITEKIKSVESKISIRTSGEIDYNSLKRKTILEYFGAYNNWETMLMNSHSNYDDDCESKNEILINNSSEAKFNYNLKEGEAELFIGNTDFFEIRRELNVLILDLQHKFESHCTDINYIIKAQPPLAIRHEQIKESKKKFHEERIEKLRQLIPARANLIDFLERELKQSFN